MIVNSLQSHMLELVTQKKIIGHAEIQSIYCVHSTEEPLSLLTWTTTRSRL